MEPSLRVHAPHAWVRVVSGPRFQRGSGALTCEFAQFGPVPGGCEGLHERRREVLSADGRAAATMLALMSERTEGNMSGTVEGTINVLERAHHAFTDPQSAPPPLNFES